MRRTRNAQPQGGTDAGCAASGIGIPVAVWCWSPLAGRAWRFGVLPVAVRAWASSSLRVRPWRCRGALCEPRAGEERWLPFWRYARWSGRTTGSRPPRSGGLLASSCRQAGGAEQRGGCSNWPPLVCSLRFEGATAVAGPKRGPQLRGAVLGARRLRGEVRSSWH
ncbi:hypothetical protein NDU88_000270 [Pleurodeles waltl]|uniref:Uncharacterized protein n=1 Tax=Pleurodeles waltl TaxID=8319 RepID=A0AAV7P2B6_PLEWA|nr:hypothetical protein NDU88_000270 [Pleurodeles waltl]